MRLAPLLLFTCTLTAEPALHIELPYQTIAGEQLKLDIAIPDATPGPHPLIVCLHGGGWSMGSRGSFRKYLPQFANLGYAAAAIQYRLAPKHQFPAPIDDVHAAIGYLRANAHRWNLDPERVTILGASAGAHLALLAGIDNRSTFNAIIDISGPTDLRDWQMGATAEAMLVKTTGKTSKGLVHELLGATDPAVASPVAHVHKGIPPVLVIHWMQDQAVAAEQAQRLLNALAEAKVPHEAHWFEGKGHALAGPGVEQIVPRTVQFLNAIRD